MFVFLELLSDGSPNQQSPFYAASALVVGIVVLVRVWDRVREAA